MEKSAACLKKSIDGESTAVKQYTAFAEKATAENLPNIANLFRSLAYAETIHIKNHISALQDPTYEATIEEFTVGSTEANLTTAIEGESYECKVMYPQFFKDIKKEQNTDYGKVAMLSMQWSSTVEKRHAKLLKKALKQLQKGLDFDAKVLFVCKVCGNIEIAKPSKPCDVCGHDIMFFEPQK